MPRIPSRAAAVWPARREQRAGGSRAGGRAGGPQPRGRQLRTPRGRRGPLPGPPRVASRTPAAALPVRSLPSSRLAAPRSPARTPTPPSLAATAALALTRRLPSLLRNVPPPPQEEKKISESLPPTPATLSPAGPPETSPSRLRFQNPRALPAVPGTPRPRPPHPRHTSRTPGPPASPHSRRRLTSAAAARAPAAGGSGAPLPAAGACSGSPQTDNEGRGLVWRQRSGAGRMPGHASFGPFLSPPTSKPKV